MGVNIIRSVCTFGQVGSVVLTLRERVGGDVHCVARSVWVIDGFLVVWRSIFRFWGEANQTPGSSGFPGVYTCIKRGIAESGVMMVGAGGGGGAVVDKGR